VASRQDSAALISAGAAKAIALVLAIMYAIANYLGNRR
jgi:hypothetical protein